MQQMNCTFKTITVAMAVLTATYSANNSAGALEMRNLSIDGQSFTVEVAEKLPDIALGLGNRAQLATDHGMLLVYPPNMDKHCVWMKGVSIPLSAAFFDENGTIINVVDSLRPGSEKYHCAEGKAAFVIEMNSGWFSRNGIKAGSHL